MFKKLLIAILLLVVFAFSVGVCFGGVWYAATKKQPKYLGLAIVIISELLFINWLGLEKIMAKIIFANTAIATVFLLYLQDKFEQTDVESDAINISFNLSDETEEYASLFDKVAVKWGYCSAVFYSMGIFGVVFPPYSTRTLNLTIYEILVTIAFAMMIMRVSGGKKSKFWETVKKFFTFQALNPLASPSQSNRIRSLFK